MEISNVNSFGVMFVTAASILMLTLPRRLAVFPVIMIVCYMTEGQEFNMGGLHFSLIRVILLVGWVRALIRHEFRGLRLNIIDKAFMVWIVSGVVIYIARQASFAALQNRLGFAYDGIMAYFLFRALIRDLDDAVQAIKLMAVIIIPFAVMICVEKMTGRNLFSVLGGVPEITELRDGKLRCQGSFRHPILAGTFGATTIPLFIAVWMKDHHFRTVGASALLAASLIVLFSASGGPLMALLAVVAGIVMLRFREHIKLVWWGALIGVVLLHMIMKAPVWFLVGHVSDLTGGTGWYRAELIDQAINHIGEWWLWGTGYTAHWMPVVMSDPNMTDITSQYIAEGVDGGILTMLLFIGVIILCFRQIGRQLRVLYREGATAAVGATWCIGVALFAHATSFLSVAYFDQLKVIWYFVLAIISGICGYAAFSTAVAQNKAKVEPQDTREGSTRLGGKTRRDVLPL